MLWPTSNRRFAPFSTGTGRQQLGLGLHRPDCDRFLRRNQESQCAKRSHWLTLFKPSLSSGRQQPNARVLT